MKKIKGLLYCCKAKPYLYDLRNIMGIFGGYNVKQINLDSLLLNGTIVAECDFEVEEHKETTIDWLCMSLREKIIFGNMCEKASIDELECYKYANGKPLYAIHIKNLHIFDEPYELGKALIYNFNTQCIVEKAPQNMMKVYNRAGECHFLMSIQPQWLCKILNGEKTIEVRRKVLKEMLRVFSEVQRG